MNSSHPAPSDLVGCVLVVAADSTGVLWQSTIRWRKYNISRISSWICDKCVELFWIVYWFLRVDIRVVGKAEVWVRGSEVGVVVGGLKCSACIGPGTYSFFDMNKLLGNKPLEV